MTNPDYNLSFHQIPLQHLPPAAVSDTKLSHADIPVLLSYHYQDTAANADTFKMPDQSQCPAHTRTPWGTSTHRYSPRLRYAFMGLLFLVILGAIVVAIASAFAFGAAVATSVH